MAEIFRITRLNNVLLLALLFVYISRCSQQVFNFFFWHILLPILKQKNKQFGCYFNRQHLHSFYCLKSHSSKAMSSLIHFAAFVFSLSELFSYKSKRNCSNDHGNRLVCLVCCLFHFWRSLIKFKKISFLCLVLPHQNQHRHYNHHHHHTQRTFGGFTIATVLTHMETRFYLNVFQTSKYNFTLNTTYLKLFIFLHSFFVLFKSSIF